MTLLVQTERALMYTREQIAAAPKAAALLVDTRTTGKAPTFTGEHKDWPEWSFQFTAYMGSANPKSIEALRWAAMADDKITEFRGAQCSTVPGLSTAVQGKCTGNSEEHRSQQWT